MTQTTTPARRIEVDADWADLILEFDVREDTRYLNHGSWGISPRSVLETRRQWTEQMDRQPMDYFVRQYEDLWWSALGRLGKFVNTDATNLIFAENATFAMNIVAESLPLESGDQVLSNNHEYGAVHRIWNRACQRAGAEHVVARLPDVFESHDQVVESIMSRVTDRTRLIVVSHITSATALIMPVRQICKAAAERGIPVCIDGPHALAYVPLDLTDLGCAYYTASCHKWLCAPLGSGFFYAHPDHQQNIQPPLKSWGRLLPAIPEKWYEEFIWSGTRDPAPYLSIPAAIDFVEGVGLDRFRARLKWMQQQTTAQLIELTGQTPIGRDVELWYGTMAHVPLPEGDWSQLQATLWEKDRIEVPVINFEDRWFIRPSHHLHNHREQYDVLIQGLQRAIGR